MDNSTNQLKEKDLNLTGNFRTILFIFLGALIIMTISCTQEPEPDPPDILSDSLMAAVLTDIHLAEAAVSQTNVYEEDSKRRLTSFYNSIYRLHYITADQFRESHDFYTQHPERLELIYDMVLQNLSTQQGKAQQ
jgi:hypothetical protein